MDRIRGFARWRVIGLVAAILLLGAVTVAPAGAQYYGYGYGGYGYSPYSYGYGGYGYSPYSYGYGGYGYSPYSYGYGGYSPYSYGYGGYSPYSYGYGYSPYSYGYSPYSYSSYYSPYGSYSPYSSYYGYSPYSYYGSYNPYTYYGYGTTCSIATNGVGIYGGTATPGYYSPQTLTVKVNTTVTWTNCGDSAHTATSNAGVTPAWDTGTLAPGQSGSFTFTTVGTFGYYCKIHGHTGTITVTT